MKHYEFTGETKDHFGHILHRIRCIREIPGIKVGQLGGWIEKEENLKDEAWVFGNARVYGNASVCENARVYGNARVFGNAWVYGNASVCENALVSGNAKVFGNAWVYGNAWVSENARVYGDARVFGNAWVSGNASVCENALVSGNAKVYGKEWVCGDAQVRDALVFDNEKVCGNTKIHGMGNVDCEFAHLLSNLLETSSYTKVKREEEAIKGTGKCPLLNLTKCDHLPCDIDRLEKLIDGNKKLTNILERIKSAHECRVRFNTLTGCELFNDIINNQRLEFERLCDELKKL